MKAIIEIISRTKEVQYSLEESTWFNGDMNVPVKTYRLNFPSLLGTLHLTGEYRRNTWQKPNWRKDIHFTDIYLWTVELESEVALPSFEISKSSWLQRVLLKSNPLNVQCSDSKLKSRVQSSTQLIKLLTGNQETIAATIKCSDNRLWTTFNTLIEHERLVLETLEVFEELQKCIAEPGNQLPV